MGLCDRGLFVSQGGCGEPKRKRARRVIFFLIIFVMFLKYSAGASAEERGIPP